MSTKGMDVLRSLPPYEIMKYHWLSGLTYNEMAELYGVTQRSGVHETLKRRAQARGEWPIERRVPAYSIWQTVRQAMREAARTDIVWVTRDMARKWAPTTSIAYNTHRGRYLSVTKVRENWPRSERTAPRFHTPECVFVQRDELGQLIRDWPLERDRCLFSISRVDAEDWGYVPCGYCSKGLMVKFAANVGMSYSLIQALEVGKRKWLLLHEARALLAGVGEPIHRRLVPKPPRVCEICGRPGPLIDEHWRSHLRPNNSH